jgi:hypothetical protein
MLLVQEEASLQKATNICLLLDAELEFECLSGVFMEGIGRENLVMHGLAEPLVWTRGNALNQIEVCESYSGIAASACWKTISEMLAGASNGNYAQILADCSRAATVSDRDLCSLNGIAFYSFLIVYGNYPEEDLPKVCDVFVAQQKMQSRCVDSVVTYVLNASTDYMPYVLTFCDSINDMYTSSCYQSIIRNLSYVLTTEEFTQHCKKLPAMYTENCLSTRT